jgi:hypothetical protein
MGPNDESSLPDALETPPVSPPLATYGQWVWTCIVVRTVSPRPRLVYDHVPQFHFLFRGASARGVFIVQKSRPSGRGL